MSKIKLSDDCTVNVKVSTASGLTSDPYALVGINVLRNQQVKRYLLQILADNASLESMIAKAVKKGVPRETAIGKIEELTGEVLRAYPTAMELIALPPLPSGKRGRAKDTETFDPTPLFKVSFVPFLGMEDEDEGESESE